jgi:hypothetical protein
VIKWNPSRLRRFSHVAVLLLLCALPASASEKRLRLQPTTSQQLLIEIHELTGVGWWSPPTREVDFGVLVVDERQPRPVIPACITSHLIDAPVRRERAHISLRGPRTSILEL